MSFEITGFDNLQHDLEEAQRAVAAMEGEIATLKVNPTDPASVQAAIQQMETAVDRQVAGYNQNPFVMQLAQGVKERFRQGILEVVSDVHES